MGGPTARGLAGPKEMVLKRLAAALFSSAIARSGPGVMSARSAAPTSQELRRVLRNVFGHEEFRPGPISKDERGGSVSCLGFLGKKRRGKTRQ